MPPRVLHAPGPPDDRRGAGRSIPLQRRADVDHFANHCPETGRAAPRLPDDDQPPLPGHAIGRPTPRPPDWDEEAERIRRENGFDPVQHEQLRDDLQRGRIGLARNRLPVDLDIRDVDDSDLIPADRTLAAAADRARRGGHAARRGRRRDARRRRRQPLDDRRRGGQGGQPVRRCSPASTAASWRSTWPRPGRSSSALGRRDPARRDDQLPDARRHRAPPRRDRATTATTARSTSRAASRSASA